MTPRTLANPSVSLLALAVAAHGADQPAAAPPAPEPGLGFQVVIPAGFQPVPIAGNSTALRKYVRTGSDGATHLRLAMYPIQSTISPAPIPLPSAEEAAKTYGPGAVCTPLQAKWRGWTVHGYETHVEINGVPVTIKQLVIPLSPKALMVVVGGPTIYAPEGAQALDDLIASLDGPSTWPRPEGVAGGVASPFPPEVIAVPFNEVRVRTHPPSPPYPPEARLARIQGTVTVELVIDPRGVPVSVKALEGPPELRPTARDHAMAWRFEPVLRGGKPQYARFNLPIPFRLR